MPPPRVVARIMTWITVGSALIAIVLGFIGFSRVGLGQADGIWASNPVGRFFDYVYFSLSMLTLMVRQTYGEPFLMVARWFGVVFCFSAVVRFLLPQTFLALNRLQIRAMKGHTVVFGLGSRGRTFLVDLAGRGPVVGFDRRPLEDLDLGERGSRAASHVLQGDAKEHDDLADANLRRARRAIICIGTDAENHAVAREIVALLRRQGRAAVTAGAPLDLIVPCSDRAFGRDLIGELDGAPVADVRPFNPHATAARTLLLRFPWLLAGERVFDRPGHWVFVGWDEYADAMLVAALTLGAGRDGGPPTVSAFVPEPDAVRDRLAARYPAAGAELRALALRPVDALGTVAAAAFDEVDRAVPVGAIFVFGRDDGAAFVAARRMRRLASAGARRNVPVFVRMNDAAGFDTGLRPLARVRSLSAMVEPFGGLTEACSETALHDWQELLAHDVHEGYRQSAAATAAPAAPRQSSGAWSNVGEALRDSNRRAVDHLPIKLAALGFVIRGELALPRVAVPLDPPRRALVARLEHRSWLAERRFEGRAVPDGDPVLVDAGPGHYEPFRRLFERPFVAGDAWLREWIAARHHAGGGAWRERVLAVAALPSVEAIATGRLEAALRAFLDEAVLDARLGADGEEFWTVVSVLESRHEVHLLRALLRVLGSDGRGTPRGSRHRVVLLRPADLATSAPEPGRVSGPAPRPPLPVDALGALGATPPIDYLIDLPPLPTTPAVPSTTTAPSAATWPAPIAALCQYMAGRADETLVFGTGADIGPDIEPGADSDRPDAVRLAPLYREAARRVVALDR